MKFKLSVRINDFSNSKVMSILQAVQMTAPEGYEPTVTSGSDGKHMPTSLHYKGMAFDFRVHDYPGYNMYKFEETKGVIFDWIERIREFLPINEYDIVFDVDKHYDHIHIEYDPNKKR